MYDYAAGKLDWLAAGLKTEGSKASKTTAKDVARTDIPTCALDDLLGDARSRARSAGFDVCVVVNDAGVVFGFLRKEELAGNDDTRVEDAMVAGPSTFRPHVPIKEMASHMERQDLASAPITTSEGKLLGVLFREDAQSAVRSRSGD